MSTMTLRVAHLYPRLMNIYGDRGNIMCLQRRCLERGIGFEVEPLELGDKLDSEGCDLVFIGGKMLVEAALDHKLPAGISLGIVALILATAIGASMLWPAKDGEAPATEGQSGR